MDGVSKPVVNQHQMSSSFDRVRKLFQKQTLRIAREQVAPGRYGLHGCECRSAVRKMNARETKLTSYDGVRNKIMQRGIRWTNEAKNQSAVYERQV